MYVQNQLPRLFYSLFAVTICGGGVFLAMALVNWAPTQHGTAAAFGIYVSELIF